MLVAVIVLLAIIALACVTAATVCVLVYLRLRGVDLLQFQLLVESYRKKKDDVMRTKAWLSR